MWINYCTFKSWGVLIRVLIILIFSYIWLSRLNFQDSTFQVWPFFHYRYYRYWVYTVRVRSSSGIIRPHATLTQRHAMFWKPGSKSTWSSHRAPGQPVRPPGQPSFQYIIFYFFYPNRLTRPGRPGFQNTGVMYHGFLSFGEFQ